MGDMERLWHQTNGVGYIVRLDFHPTVKKALADMVNLGLYGPSTSNAAQRIISQWTLENFSILEARGINHGDAGSKGYIPVKFQESKIKPVKKWGVHQSYPLRVELYGMLAYTIDEIVAMRILGTSRREVVEDIIPMWLFHNEKIRV